MNNIIENLIEEDAELIIDGGLIKKGIQKGININDLEKLKSNEAGLFVIVDGSVNRPVYFKDKSIIICSWDYLDTLQKYAKIYKDRALNNKEVL